MSDTLLLRYVKSQPKQLNLCSKKLDMVPKIIGNIDSIVQLHLKNNRLKCLPQEFENLYQLQLLNLGNNDFEDLPGVLRFITSLQILHIFKNNLIMLNPAVLSSLTNLTHLNMNYNSLTSIPPEICRLSSLKMLSMDNNKITELPVQFCTLTTLQELHIAGNELVSLPLEFGYLSGLVKLHLQKNKIRELPESLTKCGRLRIIDIAANELRIFPTQLCKLHLKELYCEENPLLEFQPVHSVQEEEILSLKEICARLAMKELQDKWSYLRRAIKNFPTIKEMLQQSSKCAVCGESFLNTWLECVTFVDVKKDLKIGNMSGVVPIRALLCSYACFNAPGHKYYGVAFP